MPRRREKQAQRPSNHRLGSLHRFEKHDGGEHGVGEKIMEIVKGIHRIVAPLGNRFVAVYLLVGRDASLLIDTGLDDTPRRFIEPYCASIGLDVQRIRYVLNSHSDFDHIAGNRSLTELAPNAIFMCHALDRAMVEDLERIITDRYDEAGEAHGIFESDEGKTYMRANCRTAPVDIALSGGESIRLQDDWHVELWHTPGHSRGHMTVVDPRSHTAIICDAALYNAVLTAEGEPAFPPTYRYVDAYLASIERFIAASFDTLLTSHYPIYRGAEVQDFLYESRNYVARVDAELITELRAHDEPLTMKALIELLSPRLGTWPAAANPALSQPLLGHLERLQQRGRVQESRRDGLAGYSWVRG
jgi:glyoxylase-like metal-dependent hydrolase (beta-lactamase superfamily II)